MAEVINFEDRRSAGGVTDEPKVQTHEEEQRDISADVSDKLCTAADLNLEDVIIVGRGDGFIHYLHSEIEPADLIYLLEKAKFFFLRDEFEE